MNYEYTAQEALDLLLGKLRSVNSVLADRAQIAIDAGIDEVLEQDIASGRGKERKSTKRAYRKHRPLTDAESITVVLEVLEAHLVVHRKVVNAIIQEFSHVALGNVREISRDETITKTKTELEIIPESEGKAKNIEIELMSESVRPSQNQPETLLFKFTPESEIDAMRDLIIAVKQMTKF